MGCLGILRGQLADKGRGVRLVIGNRAQPDHDSAFVRHLPSPLGSHDTEGQRDMPTLPEAHSADECNAQDCPIFSGHPDPSYWAQDNREEGDYRLPINRRGRFNRPQAKSAPFPVGGGVHVYR